MEGRTSGAMTCPTKRQRQAKAQHASGARTFDSGFVNTLLEVTHDPNYQPDGKNEEESGGNSPPRQLGHGSALHSVPVEPGLGIWVPVRLIYLNTLNIVTWGRQDKEPVISLPTRSMPTYMGTGCTSTYLHEQ